MRIPSSNKSRRASRYAGVGGAARGCGGGGAAEGLVWGGRHGGDGAVVGHSILIQEAARVGDFVIGEIQVVFEVVLGVTLHLGYTHKGREREKSYVVSFSQKKIQ